LQRVFGIENLGNIIFLKKEQAHTNPFVWGHSREVGEKREEYIERLVV